MLSKQTATDIALAYREIEISEKFLAEILEARSRDSVPDLRDAFGRLHSGMELSVRSSHGSSRLFNVPWSLVNPVIEAHIAHHKAIIGALTEKARIELSEPPPC